MATPLDELLVEIGIDADDLTRGVDGAADDVERSLAGVGDAADAMGRDIVQVADDASAALDDVGASADQAAQGAEQAAGNVEGSLRNIAAGAAGVAVGGLFVAGLTSAMDIKAASTKLTNQLGLTAEESERAGTIAGEVFKDGFSDSIGGVNDALASVASAMGGFGKLSDDELSAMTKNAITLAETFEMDVGEAATAAGQLIANNLVKDGTEAFDVLMGAAQRLPKSMVADIPAVITEYGKHFDRIGLDAQTAFGMMSQYVQAGGRDLDQAGDVLHEFARITSEESERAADALKEMGLPANQMLKDINAGGEPAREALQKTIEGLRGIKDPAKQAELGVALFGDMAGEGADALWAMDPATAAVATGMDNVEGAARKATEAVEESKSFDAAWRQISTTLGETLAPALEKVGDFMSEHPQLVQFLVPFVFMLAAAFGVFAISVWAVNAAMLANPITWIVLLIVGLIAIVALVILKWDELSAATEAAWEWIQLKVAEAVAWLLGKIEDSVNWITDKWDAGWSWVEDKTEKAALAILAAIDWLGAIPGNVAGWFNDVVGYVSGLPSRIGRAATGMWESIVREFKNAVNQLIWMWNSLSFTLGGGNFMGVDIPTVTLHTPDIPYLAEGGITTGPTLAMIGEGAEQEAVLPLSKLESLLNTTAPAVVRVEPADKHLVLELRGGSRAFREFFQESVRTTAGGDVVKFAEG